MRTGPNIANKFMRMVLCGAVPAAWFAACSSSSGTPDPANGSGGSGDRSGSSAIASSGPSDTSSSSSSDSSQERASSAGGSVSSSSGRSDSSAPASNSSSGDGAEASADLDDLGVDAFADSPARSETGISADGNGGSPDSGGEAGHAHTGVWRITPIGDSITEDTCGPQLMSQELIQNGHTNFILVGTETNNQNCSGAPSVESEGHAGYLVTDLLPPPHQPTLADHSAELPMWAANDKSDVLLMQFGTNDVWNGVATQTILQAYTLVLTDYRAVNPNVILFIAQITPLHPTGCGTCETNAEALNAAIPGWATSQSTAASPIYVVDVWSAFTASTYLPDSMYTADGVHPNPAGAALVAQDWYNALIAQGIP